MIKKIERSINLIIISPYGLHTIQQIMTINLRKILGNYYENCKFYGSPSTALQIVPNDLSLVENIKSRLQVAAEHTKKFHIYDEKNVKNSDSFISERSGPIYIAVEQGEAFEIDKPIPSEFGYSGKYLIDPCILFELIEFTF